MKTKSFKLVSVKIAAIGVLFIAIFVMSSCNRKANKGYKESIASADSFFNSAEYSNARVNYVKASKFKPEEVYPKNRINEIDSIVAVQKLEADYDAAIKEGDSFFNDKDYAQSQISFERAISLKEDEQYPKEMLDKISEKLAEIRKQEELSKYPYHIIVGCFTVESNATRLNEKLKAEGKDSRIISLFGGKYGAVSVASYPDITSAYNNIEEAKETYGEETWVLKN
jgi:hypothetical protein